MKYKDFYGTSGAPVEFTQLKSDILTVIFPDLQQDITGTLDFSFLYRQVIHGNRHLPEARQKVNFWYGTVKNEDNQVLSNKPIILIKKEDIRPKAYIIMNGVHPLMAKGIQPQFETVGEAAEFIHYIGDLLSLPRHTSIIDLTINGSSVNNAYYDGLQIKTINL